MQCGVLANGFPARLAAIMCAAASASAGASAQDAAPKDGSTTAPLAATAPASPAAASSATPPIAPLTGTAAPLDDPTATADRRMAALDALAAEQGTHPLLALMARARQLPMRDLRVRHYISLAATIGQRLPNPVPAEIAASLLQAAADADAPAAQIVAIRAIDAVPEPARPEGSARFAVRRVEMATVPSRMAYDTTEFSVAAGTPVCITMSNPDTLQHNLLIVAPRALSEIGIAGDKMGETAAGKACHFTPDSPKVLAVMGLVDPGAAGQVWFVAPAKPATYPYVCTYPGHWRTMNGKMKVTAPATPQGDINR